MCISLENSLGKELLIILKFIIIIVYYNHEFHEKRGNQKFKRFRSYEIVLIIKIIQKGHYSDEPREVGTYKILIQNVTIFDESPDPVMQKDE